MALAAPLDAREASSDGQAVHQAGLGVATGGLAVLAVGAWVQGSAGLGQTLRGGEPTAGAPLIGAGFTTIGAGMIIATAGPVVASGGVRRAGTRVSQVVGWVGLGLSVAGTATTLVGALTPVGDPERTQWMWAETGAAAVGGFWGLVQSEANVSRASEDFFACRPTVGGLACRF